MLDLTPATQQVKKLLNEIRDEQLSAPTPCEGFSVATMLDHFMGLTIAFTQAATKSTPPSSGASPSGPPESSAEHLDPEWRRKLPEQLDQLAEAWKNPAAWEGEATAGGVTLPAALMGAVAADEIVIHGWDIARATGHAYDCDPETAEGIIGFLSQFTETRGDNGFGEVVKVSDDASLLDRAVGLSGRDPAWTRPA